jgi:acyl phosphate:glycerol-3-phosphate acyltransferase
LGVWIGLTIWKISLPAVAAAVIGLVVLTSPGWAVMLSLGTILLVLLLWFPDPLLLTIWAGETLILAWTHRTDIRMGIRLRPWLAKYFAG